MSSRTISSREFADAFSGLDRAYGRYSNGRAKTIRSKPTQALYETHLKGAAGLGIVPIRDDGTCRFGVIDIDIENINLRRLEVQLKEFEIPAVVCRSKSGRVHIYTFYDEPGIPARKVRSTLSQWASKLGYGGSEIFPKQDRLLYDDIGNWINLPYFNESKTNRYGLHNGEPASLVEFLNKVRAIRAVTLVEEDESISVSDVDGFPPCLEHFYNNGIPTGHRNEVMFNFGIFYKRSNPDKWEDLLTEINYNRSEKPLSRKEIESIIKSLNKKEYNYRCKDAATVDYCDRLKCQQLRFGVGQIKDSYSELMIGCITKVLTDAPRWIIDMNGFDVEFTSEQLMNYKDVRIRAMEKLNIIIPPMKNEDWLQIVRQRLQNIREVEAPDDATSRGILFSYFSDFIQMANRSKSRNDVLRGIPAKGQLKNGSDEFVFFRSQDFINFLKRKKYGQITNPTLWMALREMGCSHTKIKVEKKSVQVWYVSVQESEESKLEPRVMEEAEF